MYIRSVPFLCNDYIIVMVVVQRIDVFMKINCLRRTQQARSQEFTAGGGQTQAKGAFNFRCSHHLCRCQLPSGSGSKLRNKVAACVLY